MRRDPLSPLDVLLALELFGPQARPYNFDDCFDCWGLVRRVFDHLDHGFEMDGELQGPGDPEEANWVAFSAPDELVPGDLLVTHPHVSEEFHTVVYCGQVAGLDLVYDASPRGDVPLVEPAGGSSPGEPQTAQWRLVEARALFTRYARATETTDRLRNDGGAYLRLWDDRVRYYHSGLRARLLAGAAADGRLAGFAVAAGPGAPSPLGRAAGRDLVALRRAAGVSGLPFYCLRRLPRDAAGRELYDNLHTRHLDYYVPDGAPVPDDDYEWLMDGGGEAGDQALRDRPEAADGSGSGGRWQAPGAQRPPAPHLTKAPLWVVRDGPVTVEWEYPAPRGRGARDADSGGVAAAHDAGPVRGALQGTPAVTGCRVEVWEETWDCWKRRLLRWDADEPLTAFTVPDEVLADGARLAVVIWARGPGGYSGTALAPFLYRPAVDDPSLIYDPVRPERLAPDAGAVVPPGVSVDLTWAIRQPLVSQSWFRIEVLEDAFLTDDARPVYDAEARGPAARVCKVTVPGEVLRSGHTYAWYVTVRAADRRTAFAPAEGVFQVAMEG
jgi:hypothetical protein